MGHELTNPRTPPNLHPIVQLIISETKKQGVSNRWVEIKAGVGGSTLRYLRSGTRGGNFATIEAILGALGYDLIAVKREKD